MTKPLLISIGPNIQKDDVMLSLQMLFKPVDWYNFRHTEKLENDFVKLFPQEYKCLAVNSGRSAMFVILKALGIKAGDEVCLQAFTCSAAVTPIIAVGAKPVFVDIDKSYNLSSSDLVKKINKNTKAIVVQHTFGYPADMQKISTIARKRKIALIEDCAVSLGAKYSGKSVGTFGVASFFSFGRDKIISGTFGGMIITKENKLFEKMRLIRDQLDYPGPVWTMQQLMNPVIVPLIKRTYFLGYKKLTLGKLILIILQRIKILGKAIAPEETYGRLPKSLYPKKLPGAISKLIIQQLNKLQDFNKVRQNITNVYFTRLSSRNDQLPLSYNTAVWLRFPYRTENKNGFISYFKKQNILVGDWYKTPIYPTSGLYYLNYMLGSCPEAEKASKTVVNLPVMPTMTVKDTDRICELVFKFENEREKLK